MAEAALVELCCICQDEYSSPLSELDLTRPDTCPHHWCHRDCLDLWLRSNLSCPVCLSACHHAVDQSGRIIAVEVEELTTPGQEEAEALDPLIEQLQFMLFIEAATDYLAAQRPCLLCISGYDETMVSLQPCGHRLHDRCLRRRFDNTRSLCPVARCRQPVAAILNFATRVVLYHDPRRLANPRFSELQARVGMASAPATQPRLCALCRERSPHLPRVQPACCPSSHIVHEACLQRAAGTGVVRNCPVQGCGRQFMALTRLTGAAPRNERPAVESGVTEETSGDVCCGCGGIVAMVEAVKPNTCRHCFHRECLVRKTKAKRMCPMRGCRKKFRSIEALY